MEEGSQGVASWTAKKNINIFKKKFIFIPINENLHWSLCVVVNAGKITHVKRENENDEVTSILFLDSLKAHRKSKVAKNVFSWLNSEAKRLNFSSKLDKPFQNKFVEVCEPRGEFEIT